MTTHYDVEIDYQYQVLTGIRGGKTEARWGKRMMPACGAEIDRYDSTGQRSSVQLWRVDCKPCLEAIQEQLPWEKANSKEAAYWQGWKQGTYDVLLNLEMHDIRCYKEGHTTFTPKRTPPTFACFAWLCIQKFFNYKRAMTDGSQDRTWEEFIRSRDLFRKHIGI